jgi:hypothetical protein
MTLRNRIFQVALWCALAAAPAFAQTATIADGDWSSAAIWSAGEPDDLDSASVQHEVSVTAAGEEADAVEVEAGGTLTISSGDLSTGVGGSGAPNLIGAAGGPGDVVQTGGSWHSENTLVIGGEDLGTYTVSGGTLDLSGILYIGGAIGLGDGAGTLTIDGSGATISTGHLIIGGGETAEVVIRPTANGAAGLTTIAAANVFLDLVTSDTILTLDPQYTLSEGDSWVLATGFAADSGTFDTVNTPAGVAVSVDWVGSALTVTVTDALATTVADGDWSDAATWAAGEPIAGTSAKVQHAVSVTAAGEVADWIEVGGGAGALTISSGDLSTGVGGSGSQDVIGSADGAGDVVQTGGTWDGENDLVIGGDDSGTLTISGGTLDVTDMYIGGASGLGGAQGTLTIDGSGATISAHSLILGGSAPGELVIRPTADGVAGLTPIFATFVWFDSLPSEAILTLDPQYELSVGDMWFIATAGATDFGTFDTVNTPCGITVSVEWTGFLLTVTVTDAPTSLVLWDTSAGYTWAHTAAAFLDDPDFSLYLVGDISTGGETWNVSRVTTYFSGGPTFPLFTENKAYLHVWPKTGSLPDAANVPGDPADLVSITWSNDPFGNWACQFESGCKITSLQNLSGEYWIGLTPFAQEWAIPYLDGFQFLGGTPDGDAAAIRQPGGAFAAAWGPPWTSGWLPVDAVSSLGVPEAAITLEGTKVWEDLGNALAGTHGEALLVCSGALASPLDPITVSLSNALPLGTTNLVVGISAINASFKGGVMVPSLDIVLYGLPIDAAGDLELSGALGITLPSGFSLYLQHWFADPGAPVGFAASNAFVGTPP